MKSVHTLLCTLAIATAAGNALAYRTAADLPDFTGSERVSWTRGVVAYHLHSDGAPGLRFDDVERITTEAFGIWNATCSGLRFDYRGVTRAPASPGDSVNTVAWLRSSWTDLGFSADQAAITDVQYEKD